MRLVWIMFVSLMIGFMLAAMVRSTEWMKERNKRIWGWFCEQTGGENFSMKGNWVFECEYTVDKRGKIIKP